MVHHADVVIAGAGPAGSTAAYTLARRGFSVLLLDKSSFPRKKLCGGLLTWKAMRLLERVYGLRADDLAAHAALESTTGRWSVFYRHTPLTHGQFPYPFHLVDRQPFDLLLLGAARNAGVHVVQECEALRAFPDGAVRTSRGTMRGRYLIGADGANSVTRQSFGLPRKRWTTSLASTIEIAVPTADAPRIAEYPELYAGILPAGYGWLFPNRDRMILGICGLRRYTPNFRAAFTEFLRILGEPDPEAFIRRHPLRGHPLPYGNALSAPVCRNTLLAGDAGGFADSLLGEGIFYALLTGWYAGEAVADALEHGGDPGVRYQERLARYVMPEIRGTNRLRWFLHGVERVASPAVLGQYFRLRTDALAEMVHGIRSYAWGRKKQWDF